MTKRRARKSSALSTLRRWIIGLCLLTLCVTFLAPSPRALRRWLSDYQGILRVESHAASIQAAAAETGLDPNLLAGVMMVESRGQVAAQSKAGALGLFQLMLPTAEERAGLLNLPRPSKRELLSDADLNTRLGAHYLTWLIKSCEGDEERALVAYNAGPGRLKRWIEDAGSYAAWRDARERAGNSDVLAYVHDVQHYRQRFADRGIIVPIAEAEVPTASPDSEPSGVQAPNPSAPGLIGPPAPVSQQ